jgi:hypothetical protein
MFLDRALDYFCNVHPGDLSLFALCLSIIRCLESLPVVLKMDSETSPMISLLLSVALLHIQCDEMFYMTFRLAFWNPRPGTERILCRVMFCILNSTLIADYLVRTELEDLVKSIGQKYIDFDENGLSAASEMIWIVRRILVEKTRANEVLESILLNIDRTDRVQLCGLFAVLGATIENIRPYCNIKYHENRSSALDFIAVPTSRQFEFKCYFRPFNIRQPPRFITLAPHITVYAVPVVELSAESFPHFDFILSFFDSSITSVTSVISALYVQVLAHYLKFPAFVDRITPEMVSVLSRSHLPFHSIYGTWMLLRKLQKVQVVPENCGFGVLGFEPSPFVSFLSRQILPNSIIHVHVEFDGGELPCYFGLVTDNVATRFTRFSIVEVPSGVVYPYFWRTTEFENPREISFEVNLQIRRLIWNGRKAHLPLGDHFRIIVTAKATVRVSIVVDEDAFVKDGCPLISKQESPPVSERRLFEIPEVVAEVKHLPPSLEGFPTLQPLIEPLPDEEKLLASFIEPPSRIAIHTGIATYASAELIRSHRDGLFAQLALQFSTVCLMRIALTKTSLIANPTQLFTLLMVPLEPFSTTSFVERRFPFSLKSPVWENSNYLCLGLEIESKECLKRLIAVPAYRAKLCQDLFEMCENPRVHLLAFPHLSHSYFPSRRYRPQLHIPTRFSIITISSFSPIHSFTSLTTNRTEHFPMVVVNGPTDFIFPPEFANNDCSVFTISPDDNTFVFGTAFEAILLLKHLLFSADSPEERTLLKSAYLDLFIAQSPFVLIYLARLSAHISLQIPSSPFDFSTFYQQQLVIFGSYLRRGGFSAFHDQFLSQEARVLENPTPREICRYFPEWLSAKPEPFSSPICRINLPPLDPVSHQFDLTAAIQSFRYFTRRYTTLIGFPFWEILPYWLRVYGIKDTEEDLREPTAQIIDSLLRVTNNSTSPYQLFLTTKWSTNSMLLIDSNPEFQNPTILSGPLLNGPVALPPGQTLFLSLIEVPGGWQSIGRKFAAQTSGATAIAIDLISLKPAFTSDMQSFAIDWSMRDTAELILAVPRDAFRQPFFSAVSEVASATNLCQRFPPRVVLLRALLLHHFNYIRTHFHDRVPQGLWDSMTSFVSWEDAADILSREITRASGQQFPTFTVDRHTAQQLCAAGHGDPSRSIISQVTASLKPLPLVFLQCRRRT